VLASALTPAKSSNLLNSAIPYVAFPPLLLNSHSVWQSCELHAPSPAESLLPKHKRPLQSPHHHSPAHNCFSLFLFGPRTVIVPFLPCFPQVMIQPKYSNNLYRHFISKCIVGPILFWLQAYPIYTIELSGRVIIRVHYRAGQGGFSVTRPHPYNELGRLF